jgi:2-keto-4-pentenoate hydratase
MKSVSATKAAEILFRCRQNNTQLESLPPDLAPQDLDEAYAIQHAGAQMSAASNAGFKIGLTSTTAHETPACHRPSSDDSLTLICVTARQELLCDKGIYAW